MGFVVFLQNSTAAWFDGGGLGSVVDPDHRSENRVSLCGGRVHIWLLAGDFPTVSAGDVRHYDLVVWGVGAHAAGPHIAAMDGDAIAEHVFSRLCPEMRQHGSTGRVVWMPVPQRLRPCVAAEAEPDVSQRYFDRIKPVLQEQCGIRRFLPSLIVTQRLLRQVPSSPLLSYDQVTHWNLPVQLVLAHALVAGTHRPPQRVQLVRVW